MSHYPMDLTGQKFGRLTVIKRVEDYVQDNGRRRVQYLCECGCDNKTKLIVRRDNLLSQNTLSCGCLQKERASIKNEGTTYDLSGTYGVGYTYDGKSFTFDLEDYDLIKNYNWLINKHDGYVYTYSLYGHNKIAFMHRLIMEQHKEIPQYPKCVIDHIGGESTRNDNRKCNLRVCTIAENVRNRKTSKNNTSGKTGVYWDKALQKWRANITVDKKKMNLGVFKDFNDAVKAREEAEEKYFGEFSYNNSQTIGAV